jgi:hypothetical protein
MRIVGHFHHISGSLQAWRSDPRPDAEVEFLK